MITARTLGHWGVETFNVVAARRDVAAEFPGLLPHLAGQLAALDASFVEGTSVEWLVERADGYLTSVADVITVGNTAPPPSVYYNAARSDALVALRLFELIDATTMASCEWLGCAASVRGLVAKSSDASSFLYGQKPRAPRAAVARRRWRAFAAATTARRCWRRRMARGSSPRAATPPRGAAPPARVDVQGRRRADGRTPRRPLATARRRRRPSYSTISRASGDRVGAGERIRITFSTLRVGGRHAHRACGSYKGLVADALVAKLVTAPTGGVTLPALSAAGPLVVRFSTDARSEGFYNAAADGAEDNDARCELPRRVQRARDCGGEACDSDGECACRRRPRWRRLLARACMGTSVVATPGTLRCTRRMATGATMTTAECVFVITASGGGADIRLTSPTTSRPPSIFSRSTRARGRAVLYARLTGTGTTV